MLGAGAEEGSVVGGGPVPLYTQALLPREVTGAGKVVDLCGAVSAVVCGLCVHDGSALVFVEEVDKGGDNLLFALPRRVKLEIPVAANVGGVFRGGEVGC